jgi:ribosomal-protein-alanine N-acetyltransferase
VAQSLYEKYGFVKKGIRKGYYADNHEDAFIMVVEGID